jgi:predicted metal-dependent phosphoesterase TrpH
MRADQLADLHAHTNCSDGILSPAELVAQASAAGLAMIAVTDHDTTDGVEEALAAGAAADIEVVPGIEISTRTGNREVHLLGLFIDPSAAVLAEVSRSQRSARDERADVMVARAAALGLDIDLDRVHAAAAGAPVGRPHMAQVLVDTGAVAATQDAFDRYFGIGKSCFVPKRMLATTEAIAAVHAAGGAAVVAHPGSSRVGEKMLGELAAAGLDGVEVVHPRHAKKRRHLLRGLCGRLGLLPSGGSDYHGPGRGDSQLGADGIPLDWCEGLRQCAARHHSANG